MEQGSPSRAYSGARRRRDPDENLHRRAVLRRVAEPDVQYSPASAFSSPRRRLPLPDIRYSPLRSPPGSPLSTPLRAAPSDLAYENSSSSSSSSSYSYSSSSASARSGSPQFEDLRAHLALELQRQQDQIRARDVRTPSPPRPYRRYRRHGPAPPPSPASGRPILDRMRVPANPALADDGEFPSTPKFTTARRFAEPEPADRYMDRGDRRVRQRLSRRDLNDPPDYFTLSGLLPRAEDLRNDLCASLLERPPPPAANPGGELQLWRSRSGPLRPRRRARPASAPQLDLTLTPHRHREPSPPPRGADASLEVEAGDRGRVFNYHNHHWYEVAQNQHGTFVTPRSSCTICTRSPLRRDTWSEAVPRTGSTWSSIQPRAGLELIEGGGGDALPTLPSDERRVPYQGDALDESSRDHGHGIREYRGSGFAWDGTVDY